MKEHINNTMTWKCFPSSYSYLTQHCLDLLGDESGVLLCVYKCLLCLSVH